MMEYLRIYDEWGLDLSPSALINCIVVLVIIAFFYTTKSWVWRKIQTHEHKAFWVTAFLRLAKPIEYSALLAALAVIINTIVIDAGDRVWYQKIYALVAIGLFAWIAVKAVVLVSDFILGKFDVGVRDNLKQRRIHTQVRVFRRLAVSVIILIAIASGLMAFDQIRALGVSLIASAGLAGIIIGLAAQKTIGNFFTGIQIAITQPIRIGDAVIVENEWGVIEEINLTYVVVKIWDLRRLVLPINYFVDKPFQNWTRTSADLLGVIMLYLDYSMPVDELRAELSRILEQPDAKAKWDGKVQGVQVIETSEKTMHVRVLVSAGDAPTAFDLRCIVRERLIDFIQKNHPDCLPRLRGNLTCNEKTARNTTVERL